MLAQLADLTGDGALMLRVKACEDGLWAMRDELGWSCELTTQEDSDHGETNNSGDILETALILGRWGFGGTTETPSECCAGICYPRNCATIRLSSIRPIPTILTDCAKWLTGIWAYGFPAPYGHKSVGTGRTNLSFNMDIVGGTVASLCEAYREVVRSENRAIGSICFLTTRRRRQECNLPTPAMDCRSKRRRRVLYGCGYRRGSRGRRCG